MRAMVLAIALEGCAPMTTANDQVWGEDAAPAERGSGRTCRAEGLGRFVGRPATAALAAEARDAAGAGTVRWLQPGTIVTMEFRENRLNIHLDAQNRVLRLACG